MKAKEMRALAEGLRSLNNEAEELARLDLCDGERIEAVRALQRKAHLFLDEMGLEFDEGFRRTLTNALANAASVDIRSGRVSRRAQRRHRERAA